MVDETAEKGSERVAMGCVNIRVFVWMELFTELAVGFLDIAVRGIFLDSE